MDFITDICAVLIEISVTVLIMTLCLGIAFAVVNIILEG